MPAATKKEDIPTLPESVGAQCKDFGYAIWALAIKHAQEDIAEQYKELVAVRDGLIAARDEATAQAEAALTELDDLKESIRGLKAARTKQYEEIAGLKEQRANQELRIREAEVRVREMEVRVKEMQEDLGRQHEQNRELVRVLAEKNKAT